MIAWLLQDAWQVVTPVLDNDHQTDILISHGPDYHRIQVKTVEATSEDHLIENRWQDSHAGVMVYVARNTNWGYVIQAFSPKRRKLNDEGHIKFDKTKNALLKAYHKL